MIVAVSDIHLGSHKENRTGFLEFIREYLRPNQEDISQIVLLGDILDLWRNTNSKVLLENLDILAELSHLEMEKCYLAGNHDFAVVSLLRQISSSISRDSAGVLDNVSETLELNIDGLKVKLMHGHQIDYWSSLRFYEVFSKAMCFVDNGVPELSEVWSIVNQFAVDLPETYRVRLENLSNDTKIALEQKLAGPLDGNLEGEKTGLSYEWKLLTNVNDFEDVSKRSGKSVEDIEQFAKVWENLLETMDLYRAFPLPPPHIEKEVHGSRRMAADLAVGLDEDQFLIRGHGHIPYLNLESKVADAGCWLGTKASFVTVKDGEVAVHRWPE
ncbi:MAG: metallophosphoesterase [Candidatus Thorarchaeota archaeon]